jgi:aldehyde dehydrogenase (NAD+)
MSNSPVKKTKHVDYETRLFIDGQFVEGVAKKTFPTVNPANEEVLCQVCEALEEDVNLAVAAARRAFAPTAPWRTMPSSGRRDLMLKLADLIQRDAKELAFLESLDNGKPYAEAGKVYGSTADFHLVVQCIRYYAGHADKICGTTIPVDSKQLVYTIREPVGVCAAVIPWNFPALMLAWKLGPALATGCTIIVKTSEKTPLSALKIAHLIVEAGFPNGVVNILSGYGPSAGKALAMHPEVDKIAFTGSTAVGHLIEEYAAKSNLKRVTLELGGKSPMIVFNDANLDQALAASHAGLFLNHGQCCCAGSRLYVQSGIYDAFVKRAVEMAEKRVVGDPLKHDTEQGPLVDKLQFDKVLGFIEKGKAEGAKCLTGGARWGDKGYFVKPTIFVDAKDSDTIAKEEIFGPVLTIFKFNTEEEVIERANASIFGLAAGICSRDVGRCLRVASLLRAGTVWCNTYNSFDAAQPFGGFKQSGHGRELGANGLENYLETKTVVIPMDKV